MAADPLHYVVAILGDYASGLSEAVATYQSMHEGNVADSLFRLFQQRKSTSITAQEKYSMVSKAGSRMVPPAICYKKDKMAFVSFLFSQPEFVTHNPSHNKRVRFAASPGGWAGLPTDLIARGEALLLQCNAHWTLLSSHFGKCIERAKTRYNGTYVTMHRDLDAICVTTTPHPRMQLLSAWGHQRGPPSPQRRAAATRRL